MGDVFALGVDAEFDEQFETTALSVVDFEAEEVTEIIEISPSQLSSTAGESSRISFMSSLFRTI